MAEKDDGDAVAATLFIAVVANLNNKNRKRNRNVFTPILYYLRTNQT